MRVLLVQRNWNRDGVGVEGRCFTTGNKEERSGERKREENKKREQRRTSVSFPKDKSSRKSQKAVSNHDQCANMCEQEIKLGNKNSIMNFKVKFINECCCRGQWY